MEKSKKILKVENLKKAYYSTSRTGEIITYPVLNNVSFEIEEGEFVGTFWLWKNYIIKGSGNVRQTR